MCRKLDTYVHPYIFPSSSQVPFLVDARQHILTHLEERQGANLMKGLILCAGKGTRLHPFSNDYSKTLLQVANKPIIHYCIDSLKQVNIKDIGMVIRSTQLSLFQEHVGDGSQWGVNIEYVFQDIPLGIADAVKQAESYIGADSFILLLGDNLIEQSLKGLRDAILLERYDGALLLGKVEKPQDYGIAEINEQCIIGLEEKPAHPKSNLAVLGAYAFTPNIFDAIHAIKPSRRGEYEITDAIQWLVDNDFSLTYEETVLMHTDVGTVPRWLAANRWMLQKLTQSQVNLDVHSQASNCTFIQPVVVHPSSQLTNCVIGPYVTIGRDAILDNCTVENSVVMEKVRLSHKQLIDAVAGQFITVTRAQEDEG